MAARVHTRLRSVGLFERYHTTLHFLGFDSCVVASAKYSAQDQSILTKDVLFPALRKVIETHPALGVRLEGDLATSAAFFVRLASIDLSHVVEFSDTDDLQAAFEGQLMRPFDTNADLPLWRVEVLTDNTVIFALHHCIGDGMSSVVFHATLFQGLQDVDSPDGSTSVLIPNTVQLVPPIEAVTSVRPSLRKFFSALYNLFAPVSWRKANFAWTGRPVPNIASLQTHVRLMKFNAPDVAAFSGACRTHRATLSSALYVLAVSVLSRMIANDPARYKTISADVAISLRGVAGARADVMCDYASIHHTYPSVDPNFTWAAAARYAGELREQKSKARETVGLLRFLFGNYVGYMTGKLGKKRAVGVVLSNLGRFDVPTVEGKWRIENTVFAQCDVVLGAALKLNVVGDPTGAVNIALTWGEPGIDTEFVESFISQFQDAFRGLLV
ncbi:alcohol acetyltransferase [Mycena sp. CBHHK59/15]|nr:alcohol acetyltransferase [Mycena sp. CBHHK59/15]